MLLRFEIKTSRICNFKTGDATRINLLKCKISLSFLFFLFVLRYCLCCCWFVSGSNAYSIISTDKYSGVSSRKENLSISQWKFKTRTTSMFTLEYASGSHCSPPVGSHCSPPVTVYITYHKDRTNKRKSGQNVTSL